MLQPLSLRSLLPVVDIISSCVSSAMYRLTTSLSEHIISCLYLYQHAMSGFPMDCKVKENLEKTKWSRKARETFFLKKMKESQGNVLESRCLWNIKMLWFLSAKCYDYHFMIQVKFRAKGWKWSWNVFVQVRENVRENLGCLISDCWWEPWMLYKWNLNFEHARHQMGTTREFIHNCFTDCCLLLHTIKCA